NLCPRSMLAKRANHSIRSGAKEPHFARSRADRSCQAFGRGTCLALAKSREHPGCKSMLPPDRGRLAPKRAKLPQRDRVQLQRVRGVSLIRSTRDPGAWDFVVRDSTCRMSPGPFHPKKGPDLTTRRAAHV